MPESYPSQPGRSSPEPTELPSLPPPEAPKFQFSLKQLLAFMFASAILAAGVRYLLQFVAQLPDNYATSLLNTTVCSLTLGALLYFFVRGPFLARHFVIIARRWRAVRAQRRKLETWAKQRAQEHGDEAPDKDS